MYTFCKMRIIATHLLEKYYESLLLDTKDSLQNVVNIHSRQQCHWYSWLMSVGSSKQTHEIMSQISELQKLCEVVGKVSLNLSKLPSETGGNGEGLEAGALKLQHNSTAVDL